MKVTYNISGFDCANCANNAEAHLAKQEGIEKCVLNFPNETLTIVYKDQEKSIDELLSIIKEVEEDEITITKKEKKNQDHHLKIFDKEFITLGIRLIISLTLLLIAWIGLSKYESEAFSAGWWWMFSLYLISYLVISYDYIFKFFKNIIHLKNFFDEATLMVLASMGAFGVSIGIAAGTFGNHEPVFAEAVLVMILAQIGEVLEDISVKRSHNSIVDAIDMRPETATLLKDNKAVEVNASELEIGDEILIKVGDVIPVDSVVISGTGSIDTSSVTGEFVPVYVTNDSLLYSGTTLKEGSLTAKVTSRFEDSTTSKILEMVTEGSENKARAETFVSKFARIYTPIVFILAVIIAVFPPLIIGLVNQNFEAATWYEYLYVALSFLVISCPCAIVIAVPLTYFTGVALASKRGIVIKGSNFLDRLNELKVLMSDKTGTLTTGEFSIVELHPEGITKEEFEEYIVVAEYRSTHPIAKGVLNSIKLNKNVELEENYTEIAGFGIKTTYKGHEILLGNDKLLRQHNINDELPDCKLTTLYLSVDGKYCGYVILEDTPKTNSKEMVNVLSSKGIQMVMLTGGREASASYMCETLGIQSYKSDLLPEEKLKYLSEQIKNRNVKTAIGYVGDGVNDAPCISTADIGIAMGGLGSDAAVENADIIIMNDDPIKVLEAIDIAKKTRNRAIWCIAIALLVKVLIMVLYLIFKDSMPFWIATISDSGLAVALIIFAVSLIKAKVRTK